MLPKTTDRVTLHTDPAINEQIWRRIEMNVDHYRSAGIDAINRRLEDLDHEWDIERALEANAAAAMAASLLIAKVGKSKAWLLMPAAIAGFLLQHALSGWCPPVPIMRRLGFRTAAEIDVERYALKAVRGDFRNIRAGANGDGSSGHVVVAAASA